ncbi:MAG: hypothetical protein KIT09_24590 [Bryobacteraceae bacterium]|nr:hypothetical protein [Bryobacteraceae bacterium]
MPYCNQCGTKVAATDAYCAACGGRQPGVPKPSADPLPWLTSRNAALLCYIPLVGWIAAIVVLASHRFKEERNVRFHAFQGLYLFVAWLIVDWFVSPFFQFGPHGTRAAVTGLLKAGLFVAWIVMIVKTSQNEHFRLPILGELADRSVSEQR